MYNIEQATTKLHDFLDSDMKGLLLTGTHQYQKHKLVMRVLNEFYKNAKILFRVNGMENLINSEFIGLSKKPKSGEKIKIGNNFYQFDSFNSGTWYRTDNQFDFAIVYPVDNFCREKKYECLDNLYKHKNFTKSFLCSWTDNLTYDYSLLSAYYDVHVIYDAEEEEPEYHMRVVDLINKKF